MVIMIHGLYGCGPRDREGNDYPLEAKDGDAVARIEIPAGVTSVGFVVRTQDWAKDYEEDQSLIYQK